MKKIIWIVLAGALAANAATPTLNTDIAPILYKNCATCHHAGEVAPYSLLTYQDAAKRASRAESSPFLKNSHYRPTGRISSAAS
jgi:hypothetical protein